MDAICNIAGRFICVSAEINETRTVVIPSEFFLGPTTGQKIESLFTHVPGPNIILPSNPRDVHGLVNVSSTPRTAVLFEDQAIDDAEESNGTIRVKQEEYRLRQLG
jgi:pyruvate/2-oxoglutarate/acetoin dehydrogenase E1 component